MAASRVDADRQPALWPHAILARGPGFPNAGLVAGARAVSVEPRWGDSERATFVLRVCEVEVGRVIGTRWEGARLELRVEVEVAEAGLCS
jgi:hypothetical protein